MRNRSVLMRHPWISALVALTLITTACTKAPSVSAPVPQSTSPQPTVTTISVPVPAADPSLDAVIAAFQEKYAEYRVDKVPIATAENLAPRIRAGEMDLVPTTYSLGPLTGQALLIDLMPFVQKGAFDLAPYGPLLEAGQVNGKLFALPVYAYPTLLVYNRRLVQEAGATLPAGTWTWDQFADTARRLTTGNGDGKIWGFDGYLLWPSDLVYLRAKALAPDGPFPDPAAFRESLQFFAGMTRGDLAMAPSVPWPYMGQEPPPTYWDKGKAVFGVMTLQLLQFGRLPDAAMAPLPADPVQKPALLARVGSYGIAANTAHADAAWTFLSYLAGPEGAAVLARQGFLPAYATEAARSAWAESPATAGYAALFDATWLLSPSSFSSSSPLFTMYETAGQVLSGAVTVDDAVSSYEGALARSKLSGKQ